METQKITFEPSVEKHGRTMPDGTRRGDLETLEMAVDRAACLSATIHSTLDNVVVGVLTNKSSDSARALYRIMEQLGELTGYLNDIVASIREMETTQA